MAQFQTHQKMLNLTVWEAQPDEKSVILQPLGGIVNANNMLQHESHESNWEPLHTACKLAFGYCSLSFCGQITTTVDWLQLLDMFGNFICSYCRHNKLVGHKKTDRQRLFVRFPYSLCNWHIMGSKPISDLSWFFCCIRRDPIHLEDLLSQGMRFRSVGAGITSMCPRLWSRASPNSVAWHDPISRGILRCPRGWDIPELHGSVRWEHHRWLTKWWIFHGRVSLPEGITGYKD